MVSSSCLPILLYSQKWIGPKNALMIRLLSAIGDFIVDGLYAAFRINPMNGAGILKTLRLGSWTAEAVHTDSEQHLRRFRVLVYDFTDLGFPVYNCGSHKFFLPVLDFLL